jgi:fumarate hydratase, class II
VDHDPAPPTTSAPPEVVDVPVGLHADGTRRETDSLGAVDVPAGHYWGAQTQRCLEHFDIGDELMPREVYRAYGFVKKAAAVVNTGAGRLPRWMGELIQRVCDEVIAGQLDDEFPLHVWQAGSGTQTNMNVNEVIANRCIQLVGGELGAKDPVHPNDHVNMCQSSNDTFPTAMHIASYTLTTQHTRPALERLRDSMQERAARWAKIVKIGRTHLQDATPLTVGQEWSGYAAALDQAVKDVEHASLGLLAVPIGGTAVGTGLNSPAGFGEAVTDVLSELTGDAYRTAANRFAAQATRDDMVRAHAALRQAAVALFKIANDVRWLASGPRTGLRELVLPPTEPGSSIMPGKVNPTLAEATLMVCVRVIASDVSVGMAGAGGNLELNTFGPLVSDDYLRSARILGDACDRFRRFVIEGAAPDVRTLDAYVDRSLMMVTALTPVIGYDEAATIAHYALEHDCDLRQAALENGVEEALFDRLVVPIELTGPGMPDEDEEPGGHAPPAGR